MANLWTDRSLSPLYNQQGLHVHSQLLVVFGLVLTRYTAVVHYTYCLPPMACRAETTRVASSEYKNY